MLSRMSRSRKNVPSPGIVRAAQIVRQEMPDSRSCTRCRAISTGIVQSARVTSSKTTSTLARVAEAAQTTQATTTAVTASRTPLNCARPGAAGCSGSALFMLRPACSTLRFVPALSSGRTASDDR